MDLNFLYQQQQVATMRADAAPGERERGYHQLVADNFGRRIAAHQYELGAAAACAWTAIRTDAVRSK